ncbi:MAG: uroporphyrinogen-III C-methyltransferase [Rubrivivax sp.]
MHSLKTEPSVRAPSTPAKPRVWLVGAGPGRADLLTLQAVRALRHASVVLVDDLVSDDVLRWVRRSARIVNVGKRGSRCAPQPSQAMSAPRGGAQTLGRPCGLPSTPQAFIDRLMIAEALRGERVVRLKGGDPFVFGRGGEECDALRAAGIDVEVIHGITAGIAAPAAVGIPVTDRRHSPGVAFVTGHASGPEGACEPDWQALARSGLTLVIYMGVARLTSLVAGLEAGGLAADTPAAVVSAACTPRQRHVFCTLGTLVEATEQHGLASPAIVVIGDVVQVAPEWALATAGENASWTARRATG